MKPFIVVSDVAGFSDIRRLYGQSSGSSESKMHFKSEGSSGGRHLEAFRTPHGFTFKASLKR
jgi:hypothetical protein